MSIWDELRKDMLDWRQKQQEKAQAVEGIRAVAAQLPAKQRQLIEGYLERLQPPAA